MKSSLFLISGFGTSVTCWERWDAFFRPYSNVLPIDTPLAYDNSRIGRIRLNDYADKIIDVFSKASSFENQKIVAVAHSTGGIALLKAIQKNPTLFRGIHIVLLSSVAPKGIKPVFNLRVLIGFLISVLKSFPVWNKPAKLDFFSMKWLLTDKYTFSETDRNYIQKFFQPYVSGSMGVELLFNFNSLKIDLDIIKNTVKSIIVVNTRNDKFGDTIKIAKALNCRYVQMEGSHFSYFIGTQAKIAIDFVYNQFFQDNTPSNQEGQLILR